MRPLSPHPFSMTWRDGLFLHWPFDPAEIRPHVPDPLELDTHDGRAWVSLLPFVLADAGVRGAPSFARATFPELNLRTYVEFDGASGLYFFSIDVGNRVVPPLVRGLTRLPCYRADAEVRVRDGRVEFRSVRDDDAGPPARFHASYRPDGEVFRAEPGSLDHWLAERRRMYDPAGEGVLYGEIGHRPWPLQPADATVHDNTMFEASGLPTPETEPRARYSAELAMTGSVFRRLRRGQGPSVSEGRRPPGRLLNRGPSR